MSCLYGRTTSNPSLAPGPNEDWRGYITRTIQSEFSSDKNWGGCINGTIHIPSYWVHTGYISFQSKMSFLIVLNKNFILFKNFRRNILLYNICLRINIWKSIIKATFKEYTLITKTAQKTLDKKRHIKPLVGTHWIKTSHKIVGWNSLNKTVGWNSLNKNVGWNSLNKNVVLENLRGGSWNLSSLFPFTSRRCHLRYLNINEH